MKIPISNSKVENLKKKKMNSKWECNINSSFSKVDSVSLFRQVETIYEIKWITRDNLKYDD